MINTIKIKQQQLKTGYFKTGSGDTHILIIGSCRVVNYVNYFAAMPQFTVYTLDPFNWNWDKDDNRVDYETAILSQENNKALLDVLSTCSIFIHEYYSNAGMFCCDEQSSKNIYLYGLKPYINICIPNFNDLFILFGDIVTFDSTLRKMALQDYNVTGKLSKQTIDSIQVFSNNNVEKFYKVCRLSDIPSMEEYFKEHHKYNRMFWTYNHVTNFFTQYIFKVINNNWFGGLLTIDENHVDMFANNYTYLTEYDKFFLWNEEIKNLKDKL